PPSPPASPSSRPPAHLRGTAPAIAGSGRWRTRAGGARAGAVRNRRNGPPDRHTPGREVSMANVQFEDCPRRVRASRRGETVTDSRRVRLGSTEGGPPYPVYWVPTADIRLDRLDALGARSALSEEVDGCVTFRWDRFDAVLEESELVHVHAHD